MGCSQSKTESAVIEPVETKPERPVILRRSALDPPANRIMENCVLVWLLPDSPPNIDNEKRKLRRIVSWLKPFTDWHECVTYINSIQLERVFFIIPKIDSWIDSVRNLRQMEQIYVFDWPSPATQQHDDQSAPAFNTFHDIDTLCQQLQADTDLCELDLLNITISPLARPDGTSSADFKRQEARFLSLLLMREVLFRLKFDINAKDEFVNFFRAHYVHDDEQLRIIDEFDANYRPHKALAWLTRQCFIWRVIQRIQRTPEIDIHYKIGFFVKHVNAQMNVFQENHSTLEERKWIVYRGKTMPMESFQTSLKNNCGGLLCAAGLLIAQTNKEPVVDFVRRRLESRPENAGLLFEIHVNPAVRSSRSPLASLDEVYSSDTGEKDGILFSTYTVFRIDSVEQTIEQSIAMWLVKLILITDDDPQLLRIASPLRSSDVYTNPLSYMGQLFMEKGDYEQTEQYFLAMLDDTSVLNQPNRLIRVHRGLAANYLNKGDCGNALKHYREALDTGLSYLPADHADLVPLYDGIGNSYFKLGDYPKAIQNYELAAGILGRATQSTNEQFTVDLNARLNTAKKLMNNKSPQLRE